MEMRVAVQQQVEVERARGIAKLALAAMAVFDIQQRIQQCARSEGGFHLGHGVDEIRLVDIALLPAARGRGLGGELMADILAEGEAKGLLVRIHVEHNNPAMRLYKRLGFEKIEEQGVYWLMEWIPQGLRANSQ